MPIFFTQPICHGGDCLHIALLPLCRRPPCPQDNPLWPSISIMAGDLGLPRTFGRYRLADSIYSFWRIPRLPTRLIDSKCWDMTWCARWQPQQRLVARRGGVRPGFPGLTSGMAHIVDALPRAKRGELRGCQRQIMELTHWCLPPYLNPCSVIGIGGGPDTLLGPVSHIVRGPQRQHQPITEPSESSGFWSTNVVWASGTPMPLPSALSVPSPEYMVSDKTWQIITGKMWPHLGYRSAPLQNGRNRGHGVLFLRSTLLEG